MIVFVFSAKLCSIRLLEKFPLFLNCSGDRKGVTVQMERTLPYHSLIEDQPENIPADVKLPV